MELCLLTVAQELQVLQAQKLLSFMYQELLTLPTTSLQTESNGAADAGAISWNSGLDLTPLGTVSNAYIHLVVTLLLHSMKCIHQLFCQPD
jgi:hypothetical protein